MQGLPACKADAAGVVAIAPHRPVAARLPWQNELGSGRERLMTTRGGLLRIRAASATALLSYQGEITRLKARFDRPGLYVWHCHILEHEDNEMMRPYVVGPMAP